MDAKQILYIFSLLIIACLSQTVPDNTSYVLKVPLNNFRYHYTTSISVDNIALNDVVIDTGTFSLLIFNCSQSGDSDPLSCITSEENSIPTSVTSCNRNKLTYDIGGKLDFRFGSSANIALNGAINFLDSALVENRTLTPVFDLASSNESSYGYLESMRGWMGLGTQGEGCELSDNITAFEKILKSARPDFMYFALDLNTEGQESSLAIGGYDDIYANSIQWGDYPIPTSPILPYTFMLSNPTICGVPISPINARSMLAVIDTGSSCLTLPSEMFDSFVAWAPLKVSPCPEHKCQVTAEALSIGLPSFSFTRGYGTPSLNLPLESLLMPIEDGVYELCVSRGADILNEADYFASPPTPIVFGAVALRGLYTVINVPELRVGLAVKDGIFSSNEENCAPIPTCNSASRYDKTSNSCLSSKCSTYLAYRDINGTCQFSPYFGGTLWAVCLILFLTDFGADLLSRYMTVAGLGEQGVHLRGREYRFGQKLFAALEFIWRVISPAFHVITLTTSTSASNRLAQ